MSPHEVVNPQQLQAWLRELARNPLEGPDLEEIRTPSDPEEDPERALDLQPNGVPTWWPRKNPATLEPLSEAKRTEWFLSFLAGELQPAREILLSDGLRSRRQTIARCLLRTLSGWNSAEIPTPGS